MYVSKIVLALAASVGLVAAMPDALAKRAAAEACTRDVNACPWSKYVRAEEKREFIDRAIEARAESCTRDASPACPWSKYVREAEVAKFVERAIECSRDPYPQCGVNPHACC